MFFFFNLLWLKMLWSVSQSNRSGDWSKKVLVWFMFCLYSLPGDLWCLVLHSSVYAIFSLFFCVYSVRGSSNFINLHVTIQFSQHHLLKRLGFLHCVVLSPVLKINCLSRYVGLFLHPLFSSIDPYVCVCANITLFWLLYLCSIVWSLGELCHLLCSLKKNISYPHNMCGVINIDIQTKYWVGC